MNLIYKGYIGKVDGVEDGVIHGRVINTKAIVTFKTVNEGDIEKEFKQSVDEYLAFCKEDNLQVSRTGMTYSVGLTREWLDMYGGPRPDVVLEGTRCDLLAHGTSDIKGLVLYTYEEQEMGDRIDELVPQYTVLIEGDTVILSGKNSYEVIYCLQSHKINVVVIVEEFDEQGTIDYKMVTKDN